MSDYEVIDLVLSYEKTGVEYGQYIMAGMFAFVLTVFVVGHRMTRPMLLLLTFVYSAYVIFLVVGVYTVYQRAALLSASAASSSLRQSALRRFVDADGYYTAGISIASFWLVCYVLSIVFVILVRRRQFLPHKG